MLPSLRVIFLIVAENVFFALSHQPLRVIPYLRRQGRFERVVIISLRLDWLLQPEAEGTEPALRLS